ncbi:glycine--tRNA ligase subunit beta [Mangrovibacillus cuniculi]|uniref:Glycine--tRNA ligase beta subunit n=1 Tax=Mangrovibacillus cuniculi TaxID=2593652 RepID=A0A7S8CBH0_9BACI|nr:glycine--tRNA ligase subunit beta [Mangrovibacillus cuniculi]QPC46915.1 glycine--tRNA ligase subunit beta [Mangrovibacillus cuniculi]
MTKDLLLEIGLEEMPARFVTQSSEDLEGKVRDWLVEQGLSFASIERFSTPRRLAVRVNGLVSQQEDKEEIAKGPAKKIAVNENGEWTKAAVGFVKGQGGTVDDLFFQEIKGIEYVHVKKFTKGKSTIDLLPQLEKIVISLTFPKNMKWGSNDLRYVRPIKWLACMFGSEVIPFSVVGVETGRTSQGHRFLGKETAIEEPSTYEKQLLAEYVVVDAFARKEAIVSQLEKLAEEKGWIIPVDPNLLEEVTNLVEYPTALFGAFEEAFLTLPEEVLITSMKEHQRYFPVKSQGDTLLPFFVTVRNGNHEHMEKVAKGNEKVLRARLSDADFFYKEDQKKDIESFNKKLAAIVYQVEIGTLAEKVERITKLTSFVSDKLHLESETRTKAVRAAEISKFDLVSQMVYEFPELQGTMGRDYATRLGEEAEVAQAIEEHYQPRSAEDTTAESKIGAIVAISDKLDTIASSFAIGRIPTGSQDPYALRRQATGIVLTLMDHSFGLSLKELFNEAVTLLLEKGIGQKDKQQLVEELTEFFTARVKQVCLDRGVRHDIIDAVLSGGLENIPALVERAIVLDDQKNNEEFKPVMESLGRVINLSKKLEGTPSINKDLAEHDAEKALIDAVVALSENTSELKNMDQMYNQLKGLQPVIDQYFEHTMVMVDDEGIKHNRLSTLATLAAIILPFVDPSLVLVKS